MGLCRQQAAGQAVETARGRRRGRRGAERRSRPRRRPPSAGPPTASGEHARARPSPLGGLIDPRADGRRSCARMGSRESGSEPEAIDAARVAGAVHESGFLDDARSTRRGSPRTSAMLERWGADRIARAFSRRGVSPELVEAALADQDRDGELEAAVALLGERLPVPPVDDRGTGPGPGVCSSVVAMSPSSPTRRSGPTPRPSASARSAAGRPRP